MADRTVFSTYDHSVHQGEIHFMLFIYLVSFFLEKGVGSVLRHHIFLLMHYRPWQFTWKKADLLSSGHVKWLQLCPTFFPFLPFPDVVGNKKGNCLI